MPVWLKRKKKGGKKKKNKSSGCVEAVIIKLLVFNNGHFFSCSISKISHLPKGVKKVPLKNDRTLWTLRMAKQKEVH